MALTVIAIPLAIVSWVLGAFRLAIVSLYFSCAAWVPFLIARDAWVRADYLLAVLGAIGLGILGILFYRYVRT
jgi:uncharacterized membrane protein YvlD (DUF360 family)